MDPLFHIFGLGIDPTIIVFGFGIGLLIGMTGMGGASLMTPMLILVFGIQPVTAIGTDIFYAAVTKTVGGYKHLKLGTVHRALALWLVVGSVPSAIAWSIRGKSCMTTRPAPRLVWPTSELPICPSGSPT